MKAFSFRHQNPAWQRQAVQPRVVHFTLLELLLAIAVLLILLGFLFQFINSTQRIWIASEKTAEVFAQAQISLQLLEKDLQAGLFSSETDDPGHAMLMGGSSDRFFFFTQDSAAGGDVGTYLVMYTWNDNVLTRYVWDEIIKERSEPPHYFYGLGLDPAEVDISDISDISDILRDLEGDPDKGCVLATGVSAISIESPPGTDLTEENSIESPPGTDLTEENSLFFFTALPKVLKITLTLYDAKAVQAMQETETGNAAVEQKIAETERKFSKIVFLR